LVAVEQVHQQLGVQTVQLQRLMLYHLLVVVVGVILAVLHPPVLLVALVLREVVQVPNLLVRVLLD
jgi:hypothetical protein